MAEHSWLKSLRDLYDFRSNFAQIGGLRYHYIDEGEGHPVVLVHGNPTWSFMYRDLIKELRPHYRCLAPDHIGCGLSEKPTDEGYSFTMEQRVKDLSEWIDGLNLAEPFTLIVHDWGGVIGSCYAVRNPDRVARLVIMNTAGFPVPRRHELHWTIRFCKYTRLGAGLIWAFNAFSVAATFLGTSRTRLPRRVRKGYRLPYRRPQDRRAIVRFIQDIPLGIEDISWPALQETDEGLSKLSEKPMLLCWGEKDFVFDEPFQLEWRRRFPKAYVCRLPLAGHFVLEDGGQEVIHQIRAFLDGTREALADA